MSDEPTSGADRIADRYGRTARKPWTKLKRWQAVVFTAVALGVSGFGAYVGYQNLAGAPVEAQRIAYEERENNAVEITIDVSRNDADREVVCIVRARNISGQESGRKEILVPPGQSRVSTVIESIGQPVTADVYGCGYDIPEYMSRA
ncbi:hypothetical protein BJF85_10140 [Saccharomonospora sp. CUA-673]|uniref:DUF4307 domain-containing protein n=1 Tax=Saccharomonospora sp. CUA-673 TaxID=1904969 RepID=UPI00095DDEDD|nr:DUF4307 domain-containing protein [Saccharomonospora sp. CUA-673]OLT49212.1 hypothetical protein BJF85_10140 [Saccharomonospora sp. CUA-673]